MRETHQPGRVLRRVGAVLAGLLAVVILSTATDALMHATGVFPPLGQPMSDGLFLLATAYRIDTLHRMTAGEGAPLGLSFRVVVLCYRSDACQRLSLSAWTTRRTS